MANIVQGDNVINVQMVPIMGNLNGTVTDSSTGQAIESVMVSLPGMSVYTNSQGEYEISGIAPGTYIVTFEKLGYYTETR